MVFGCLAGEFCFLSLLSIYTSLTLNYSAKGQNWVASIPSYFGCLFQRVTLVSVLLFAVTLFQCRFNIIVRSYFFSASRVMVGCFLCNETAILWPMAVHILGRFKALLNPIVLHWFLFYMISNFAWPAFAPRRFTNFFSFWLTLYGIYFLITFFTDHIGVFLCVWVCGKSEFVASAALCRPLPSSHVCALVMCVLLCQHWAIVHWELTGIIMGDCGMSFQPSAQSPIACLWCFSGIFANVPGF